MLGTLGMISAPLSTHSSHPRRKRSAVRRYPGQSRQPSATSRRARRPGVPSLVPPRGVGADASWPGGGHTLGVPRRWATPGPLVGGGLRPAPLGRASCHADSRWFRNTSPTSCRGGPVCPPLHASCAGPAHGPTHGSAPTVLPEILLAPRKRAGTEPRPYRPIGSGPMGHRPLRGFLGSPERAGLFGPAALAAGMDAVAAAQRQVEALNAGGNGRNSRRSLPPVSYNPSWPPLLPLCNIGLTDICKYWRGRYYMLRGR